MKKSKKIILGIALVLLAGIYYYIALPAVNIHSSDTWFFLLFLLVVLAVAYAARKRLGRGEIRKSRPMKFFLGLILGVGIVYLRTGRMSLLIPLDSPLSQVSFGFCHPFQKTERVAPFLQGPCLASLWCLPFSFL